MIQTFLILLIFGTCTAVIPIHRNVFYWDMPPYIWKENGTVKGIFPQSIRTAEKFCNQQSHSDFHQVKGGYKEFAKSLYRQTYVETDNGTISTSQNDSWIPFLNASEQSARFNYLTTLSTSKEMVVVVPRYKIEILHKIGVGLLRSRNFVALCFILALMAGIIVWFIVSKLSLVQSHAI